jgi:hypothetical protein
MPRDISLFYLEHVAGDNGINSVADVSGIPAVFYAFSELRKATVSFVISVCLFVRPLFYPLS